MEKRPNQQELVFLNHSYSFFLDVQSEIFHESFWEKDDYYRFSRIRDAILVYSEVLEYEPIEWVLDTLKKLRPPMEAELSKEFLLFIRNLVIHFPFFKSWDEVKFSKGLINWSKPGRTIDKFLTKYEGQKEIKYRMWESEKKTMTYFSINFPASYKDDDEIELKNIIPEKEGILFLMSLMYRILATQIESVNKVK